MRGKSRRTEKVEAYLQTEEGLNEVATMIEEGHSMEQVAQSYGISRMILHRWTKKYGALEEVMDAAKEKLLDAVEGSLYNLCFDTPYTESKSTYDREGRLLRWTTKEGTRPASLKAIIFVLCNERPEKWSINGKGKSSNESYDPIPKVIVPEIVRRVPTESE